VHIEISLVWGYARSDKLSVQEISTTGNYIHNRFAEFYNYRTVSVPLAASLPYRGEGFCKHFARTRVVMVAPTLPDRWSAMRRETARSRGGSVFPSTRLYSCVDGKTLSHTQQDANSKLDIHALFFQLKTFHYYAFSKKKKERDH
jgi:hypothetical protein